VALELAVDPGPIRGVVSIASASRLGEPGAWRERARLVRRAGTSVMVAGSVQRWFAAGFPEREPDLVGAMLHDLEDVDDTSYALCCEALAAYDVGERLGQAVVPVLLVPGALDPVVTPHVAQTDRARLPDARLHVVPGVAHQPPAEAPHAIAALLQDFMEATDD
jgi:pimeloyl-ACP methyl ester carboxylesterase